MSRVTLLGVPIDALTKREALDRLRSMLVARTQGHVMTPNAEMLVESGENSTFRSVLERSALNLPDSVGLLWMARLTGQRIPERVTGVDTVTALLETVSAEHPVFLLGAALGVADRAAAELRKRNPALRIVGTHAGSPRNEDAAAIIAMINRAAPHLLLVAFGAPAQDLWIAEHLRELPSVRVAIGVGGTFDFLAGTARRAPKFLQSIGCEWLWRVLREPWRIRRILNAVVVFPVLVMRYGKNAPRVIPSGDEG